MSRIPRFSTLRVTRPSLEKMKTDFGQIHALWDEASTDEERVALIEAWQDARAEFEAQATLAFVRFAQDTSDAQAKEDNAFFHELFPDVEALNQAMIRRLVDSPHRDALVARYGRQAFDSWELGLTTFDPEVADDQREIAQKCNRYQELRASIRVHFEGKEWTLSSISARTGDADRAAREGAQRAKQA